MLCEICGKRSANVHETRMSQDAQDVVTKTIRHLCEVCAGHKTEEQMIEEAAVRQELMNQYQERRRKELDAITKVIQQELIEPRAAMLKERQVFSYGSAVSTEWKLLLKAVGSRLADVDPMEALFGVEEAGKNHVVRVVKDWEVHLIRWDADPNRILSHIFEPFPNAGANLDLEQRLLFVEAELDLFPNSFRSLTYCNLTGYLLSTCSARERGRVTFQFKSQKPVRKSDLPGRGV